ncbi:hypothetical protein ACN26Y_05310 [Micromonospora sp. WMMD558]|uniref:hypothetical protein n=1 Tax=unclassified Micromonospora TaxID=2617518 RepID=UPI0012B47901|nr:hypothetical protein [Micromonospora sp. WMMC415]QGN45750.1 hypothetical protein GKC29_02010 [Micromonospora sp. WMMC415]
MDALRARGWTKFTWHSIATMILGLLGVVYLIGWGATQLAAAVANGFAQQPIFWLLFAFWVIYPAVMVRNLGWKAMLVEALIIPELVYTIVRMYWLLSSLLKSYFTPVSAYLLSRQRYRRDRRIAGD